MRINLCKNCQLSKCNVCDGNKIPPILASFRANWVSNTELAKKCYICLSVYIYCMHYLCHAVNIFWILVRLIRHCEIGSFLETNIDHFWTVHLFTYYVNVRVEFKEYVYISNEGVPRAPSLGVFNRLHGYIVRVCSIIRSTTWVDLWTIVVLCKYYYHMLIIMVCIVNHAPKDTYIIGLIKCLLI